MKVLILLLLMLCLTFAQGQGKAELPKPTGVFGVSRIVFDWTDKSRPEVATNANGGHRELLVYLYYPARKNVSGRLVEYFPNLKKIESFEEQFGKNFLREEYGESYDLLRNLRTNTLEDSKLSSGWRRYPVVIFSHGGGIPVLFYSAIIEDLVSHGYVVAAVEHSYDGATVVFPDGRTITQAGWDKDADRSPDERAAFHLSRIKVGAADDSFVLDQLVKLNNGSLPNTSRRFQGRLDLTRVGTTGHSFGGKVAVTACQTDKRFKFCLNLDGGLDAGTSFGFVTQPVAGMFGYRKIVRKQDEAAADFLKRRSSMEKFINQMKIQYEGVPSASRFVLIDSPGFSHYSYYDVPNAQAEVEPWRATPEEWRRNKEIIRAFTVAAFDAQLRSEGSERLNSLYSLTVEKYPEVRIETLGTWKNMGSSWIFNRALAK